MLLYCFIVTGTLAVVSYECKTSCLPEIDDDDDDDDDDDNITLDKALFSIEKYGKCPKNSNTKLSDKMT